MERRSLASAIFQVVAVREGDAVLLRRFGEAALPEVLLGVRARAVEQLGRGLRIQRTKHIQRIQNVNLLGDLKRENAHQNSDDSSVDQTKHPDLLG